MDKNKVFFRVDSSAKMGVGHLMRCINLAKAIQESENTKEIVFVCRDHAGNMNTAVSKEGFRLIELCRPQVTIPSSGAAESYDDWFGVSQEQDAAEVIELFKKELPDILIVDSYAIDQVWQNKTKPYVQILLMIDDLANRVHICDILLDQNYSTDLNKRYAGLVQESTCQLLGPSYVLLKKDFLAHKPSERVFSNTEDIRLLLFLSGSDQTNELCLTLLTMVYEYFGERIYIDVVIGAGENGQQDMIDFCSGKSSVRLHINLPHLGEVMAKADIAIGSGGTSTWERLYMGLPAITISIAENQVAGCVALGKEKLICYLGDKTLVRKEQVVQALDELMHNTTLRRTMSESGQQMVDGNGAGRVVKAISDQSFKKSITRSASFAEN